MSNTPSLLGCPFCGAPASGYPIEAHQHSSFLKNIVGVPDHGGSYVIEGNCACGSGLIGETEAEVTERWNRRTPQPVAREPLTDGQAKEVLWNEHLLWMNAAGLDTEGMRPTGEWLDHWLFYVRAIERAHGITQKGGS